MGSAQAIDPRAMPLKNYLAETIELITAQPNATEILVERVKPLRFAELNSKEKYEAFFKQFNDAMNHPTNPSGSLGNSILSKKFPTLP